MASQIMDITAGDVIIREDDQQFSREELVILDGETLGVGYIGCLNSAGKVVAIGSATDDVYTLTMAAGTDGGTFAVAYRGAATAALAFNVSEADLQIAVRALHVDLDAAVVASAGGVGVDYTITIGNAKTSGMFVVAIVQDSTADGAVWEGGIHIDLTTPAERPSVIGLVSDDWTPSGADGKGAFLVRNAIVNVANLTGGDADVYVRLAEPKSADDAGNGAGYGKVIARTGPTYTTL